MSGPVLWLVSPVYLDTAPYRRLREDVLAVLRDHPHLPFSRIRFVAADDTGGHDPDVAMLEDMDDVLVVHPPFNLGHQRALVYALRMIAPQIDDHDFIVTLDSDGEDQPADLPRLLEPLLKDAGNTRRIAIARRTRRRESFVFKIFYFFFRILFRVLAGVVIRSGNYVAYRGWLARRLLFHPHFDLCYSSTFISLNLVIDYVPAERGLRYGGQSRMTWSKLLLHGIRMLLPFTDRIAVRALVVFSLLFGLSAIALLISIAGGPWAIYVPLSLMLFSFVAAGNLIILLAAFTQARGSSLRNLERENDGAFGVAPPPAD